MSSAEERTLRIVFSVAAASRIWNDFYAGKITKQNMDQIKPELGSQLFEVHLAYLQCVENILKEDVKNILNASSYYTASNAALEAFWAKEHPVQQLKTHYFSRMTVGYALRCKYTEWLEDQIRQF